MIHSLPKSLIEAATQYLQNKSIQNAYVSFRDVGSKDGLSLHEDSAMHLDTHWMDKEENPSAVKLHLRMDHQHTDDDRTHVFRYTAASTPLNKHLYAAANAKTPVDDTFHIKGSKNFTHDLKGLDAAIGRNKLKHDLVSYSGVSWHPESKMTEDGSVNLPSYTSTTTSKHVAHAFSVKKLKQPGEVHILQIHHPVGSTGFHTMDNPNTTYFPTEDEYVMPRNTTLKIHKNPEIYMDHDNNKVHIWKATRQTNTEKPIDTSYVTPSGHSKVFDEGGIKVFRTDTLSAYKQHYPEFHKKDHGIEFHEKHVDAPVYHLHDQDGKVWQSGMSGTNTIFHPLSGKSTNLDKVLNKYPQLEKIKHLLVHPNPNSME